MSTYVDDMMAPYRGMKMSHLISDTDEELHAMAARIGVQRRWHQSPPKASMSHYDIAMSKRALAIRYGAIQITWRQAGCMAKRRKLTGSLGNPEDAEEWLQAYKEIVNDQARENSDE